MSNPVGRPPLPAGKKKVQIAAKVAPETARYLAAEKERSGKSLGALLDEAALAHAWPKRLVIGERPAEDTGCPRRIVVGQKPADEDCMK